MVWTCVQDKLYAEQNTVFYTANVEFKQPHAPGAGMSLQSQCVRTGV